MKGFLVMISVVCTFVNPLDHWLGTRLHKLDPDKKLRLSRDVCIYEYLEIQAVTLHKYETIAVIRTILEKDQSHQQTTIVNPLQKLASAVIERSVLNLNKDLIQRNNHNTQQIRQINLSPLQTFHHNDSCRGISVEKLE